MSALHSTRIPVLGVRTTFATDTTALLDLIEDAYGAWREIEGADDVVAESSVTVTVRVDPALSGDGRGGFLYRVPEPERLDVSADGATGTANTRRLEAVLRISPDLAAEPHDLVEGLIEPLTLFLIARRDRQPVHAAGVTRGDVAVLIAGPSGTGKSTLAYAAARAGYGVLADEPVYIQLEPVLRAWGRRSRIHLLPDARSRFPELADHPVVELQSGKRKIVVEPPGGRRYAERVGICLLARGDVARLEPIPPDVVVGEMTAALDEGYDLFSDSIGERIARVAGCGGWRLTVGDDPAAAVPLLDRAVRELESGGR